MMIIAAQARCRMVFTLLWWGRGHKHDLESGVGASPGYQELSQSPAGHSCQSLTEWQFIENRVLVRPAMPS
jgi:hypothetical protein